MSMVSVIIPFYNEEKTIGSCLFSLEKQTYKQLEIILVDDGSKDNSKKIVEEFIKQKKSKIRVRLFGSPHRGTARARNEAVSKARGEILAFVDSDMTFDPSYIKTLIQPITAGQTSGTFTKDEYVQNWNNVWARAWNYNEGISSSRRIPQKSHDTQPVFRAILKSEFEKVGGFDDIGFTDDWTLSRKLKYRSTLTTAVCYHNNPSTLFEVYSQARWIGKNEFISGSFVRSVFNVIRYNPIVQILRGFVLAARYRHPYQIIFQCVYAMAIVRSILGTFLGEPKYKE